MAPRVHVSRAMSLPQAVPTLSSRIVGRLIEHAEQLEKPHLVLDLTGEVDIARVRAWAAEHRVRVLNVAGPREGENPGVHERAVRLLKEVLS